jgi:hypothetical protein
MSEGTKNIETFTTTGGVVVELKKLSVREWRELQTKVSKINGEPNMNDEARGVAFMDAGCHAVVQSVNGAGLELAEALLDLPLEDYLEIWAKVQAIILPKAMTSGMSTDAHLQG